MKERITPTKVRNRITLLTFFVFLLSSCSIISPQHKQNDTYTVVQPPSGCKGILEPVIIPSSEDGMIERRAFVYLPADYYDTDKHYPVFYLLHGARGSELSWIDEGSILSIVDSLGRDFILVLPNMNSYKDHNDYAYSRRKGALSSFFGVDGAVESVFVHDVVGEIDRHYRTIPDKEHRALAGISLGAMQTIFISADSPDTFGSLGLFSAMNNSYIKPGDKALFYKDLWQKLDAQFADPPQDYDIMIGRRDFYYSRMVKFDRQLSIKGYPHFFFVTDGGHQWKNWKIFSTLFIEKSKALAPSSRE